MKNVSIILLVCIYSLSTFGFGLKGFYCCGKLESVSVKFVEEVKDKGNNKDCCKTKYQYFKIKDNHVATAELTAPAKYYTDLVSFNPSYEYISFLPQQVKILNSSHAPPLYKGVPIYLSNCVFRI